MKKHESFKAYFSITQIPSPTYLLELLLPFDLIL